jgi:hypothetical protein
MDLVEGKMTSAPRKLFELPHTDDLAGGLVLLAQRLTRPVANTLDEVDVYRGLAPHRLFPKPRRVPTARLERRWRVPGLVSEDISFPSAHRPLGKEFRKRYDAEYTENHTVYARRLRPRGARRRPRLLYIHGYMQPETYIEEFSLLAGMALYLGVEIVQVQPPYHGRRSPGSARFGGEYYWSADLVRSVEALRQSILDARSLLTWMLAEDERPVGVMGLSLGGALTATLTCLEKRFAFSIPLIAHMDLEALVADAPVLSRMRSDLRRFGWRRREFARFVRDLGWYELRPLLPPRRIRLFAASRDRFFDPAVVERMWRDWGEPAIDWYPSSHMGFLPHLPTVLVAIRDFIDRLAAEV